MKSLKIWQCRKTGECCKRFFSSGPQVTSEEASKIIDLIDNAEIQQHFSDLRVNPAETKNKIKNDRSLPLQNKGTCIFLQNNECLIHDAKPKVCRDYPLHIKKTHASTEVLVDLDCPRGNDLIESIKNGNIPESVGVSEPISVRGSFFYEDMVREKLGEDA